MLGAVCLHERNDWGTIALRRQFANALELHQRGRTTRQSANDARHRHVGKHDKGRHFRGQRGLPSEIEEGLLELELGGRQQLRVSRGACSAAA